MATSLVAKTSVDTLHAGACEFVTLTTIKAVISISSNSMAKITCCRRRMCGCDGSGEYPTEF